MQIDVLPKEAALTLVRQHLTDKYNINDENANLLCEKVQYLPLALQQAISYIRTWSISIDEYLSQFEHHADKLMKTFVSDERYDKTIMTTWDMAYQKIKNEDDSSFAITLINMMSYLDGSSIKKELFYEYYDKYLVQTSLQTLHKYSLITINSSDDDLQQIIQMHSLLQYVVRTKSKEDYLRQFLDMVFNISEDENKCSHSSYGEHLWHHLVFMLGKSEWFEAVIPTFVKNVGFLQKLFESKGKYSALHLILNNIDNFQIETLGHRNPELLWKLKISLHRCLIKRW